MWNRLFGLLRMAEATVSGEGREPDVVAELLHAALLGQDPAAAERIGTLLIGRSPEAAIRLGEEAGAWLPRSPTGQEREAWIRGLRASRASVPAATVPLAGMLSFHGDGYVREAAVRALIDADADAGLHYLMVRANDWVAEVRELAAEAALSRIPTLPGERLAELLPLGLRLGRAGRGGGRISRAVLEALQGAEGREALVIGTASHDADVRRCCFDLLAEHTGPRIETVEVKTIPDIEKAIARLLVEYADDE